MSRVISSWWRHETLPPPPPPFIYLVGSYRCDRDNTFPHSGCPVVLRVNVHLYDCDKTSFPNLALLKLSAWHKAKGHSVVWNQPLFGGDINYSSRVFSWSDNPPIGDYQMGGWIDSPRGLPDEIEHTCPDYKGMDYSVGFLSRGCIRSCSFCIVPTKEGWIRQHAQPDEFVRHRQAVFLDNNWLASTTWEHDYEWLKGNSIKCDFNQGLDARLVDRQIAERLSRLRWIRSIRFACDSQTMIPPVSRAVQSLRHSGYSGVIFIYCLVRKGQVDEAQDRVEFLRSINCDPFAQPFMDDKGRKDYESRRFARWVNHKAIFKTVKWEDYH